MKSAVGTRPDSRSPEQNETACPIQQTEKRAARRGESRGIVPDGGSGTPTCGSQPPAAATVVGSSRPPLHR
ncbi:hypothetical protein GWI33_006242 [Rhynchophorus ferrugineus]|uniref:Uncharacterized protein n=1 Tax=Rhynchophorus ferrugineus TaxID=354439 RepID=A0A834MFL8_RHYFE|nr:hypothetical protein GWI33_006242 [Rhynchophorus ferrugineus]